MSKKSHTKRSKAAIIGISSLISLGSISVAAGCYFGVTSSSNTISNSSQTNSSPSQSPNTNRPNQTLPESPLVPPSEGHQDNGVLPSPQIPPVLPEENQGGSQDNSQGQDHNNGSQDNQGQDHNSGSQGNNGNDQDNQPQTNPDQGGGQDNGSNPTPPPVPPVPPKPPVVTPDNNGPKMKFSVNVTRTSGLFFQTAIPQFEVIDVNTNQKVVKQVDDFDDGLDGVINLELPRDGRYKIKLIEYSDGPSFKNTKYEHPTEVIFDKSNPNVEFRFKPIIEDYKPGRTFKKDDVASELWVDQDILGNPISLRRNKEEGKMTILMHMRTTCSNSIATMNAINKAIRYPSSNPTEENTEIRNHVEVICITDYPGDDEETLRLFAKNRWPEFHFVKDADHKFLNSYFPNDSGYPKFAILDYEGVIIERNNQGKVDNQKAFEKFIPKYSLQGVKDSLKKQS